LSGRAALVISTTLFSEQDRVPVVDDDTRHDYLKRAFDLGKGFAEPSGAGVAAA
jgi:hypothetical protein